MQEFGLGDKVQEIITGDIGYIRSDNTHYDGTYSVYTVPYDQELEGLSWDIVGRLYANQMLLISKYGDIESPDDKFERQLNEVRRGVKASEVHE